MVALLGNINNPTKIEEARQTDISYCTRIGRQRSNYDLPILVMFQQKENKEKLMREKRNLPTGVHVNEEFPLHIKQARDKLHPVLKYLKTNAKYKDKCRIQGDKLIVDGMKYTMDNIGELPTEIAASKAAEMTSDMHLIFHGELSPYGNFHPRRFTADRLEFATTEHYIQYKKSLLFEDSVTANQILKSATALEVKKLS